MDGDRSARPKGSIRGKDTDTGKLSTRLTPYAKRCLRQSGAMTEPATVFWYSIEMFEPDIHATISRGRERKFENLESAVRFVMESLPDEDRSTAIVRAGNRSIQIDDIVLTAA